MARMMTRKISFKPTAEDHRTPARTKPARQAPFRVTEPMASRKASAQVVQVFGTHRVPAKQGANSPVGPAKQRGSMVVLSVLVRATATGDLLNVAG
jgi:hypothetical protein